MLRKTKTILATLFLFFISTGIMAQEKYEYAELIYNSGGDKTKMLFVQSGHTRSEIAVSKEEYNSKVYDNTPIFNHLAKMTEDGWTIVDIHDQIAAVIVVLKRKEK